MQSVLIVAIVLFVIAAILGAIVLFHVLKNKNTPKPVVIIHGVLAAIGLLLVIYYAVVHAAHAPITSLVLFIIAAIGGFTLFGIDMAKRKLPKWLAVIHPIIAAAGLIALIVFVVR
jgi:glucose uptake protein GlcU